MARRCSHCNHDGHNSRTCPNRGVRIFGVRLSDGSLQKSASTGNLAVFARSGGASPHVDPPDPSDTCGSGYVSEGFNVGAVSHERKKGVPWTEHEHKMFLVGLKKLGRGDWRGIARSYVISRTPTQVASHAQKYFIRHSANNRRKRRISLFDIVADETSDENLSSGSPEQEVQDTSCIQITEEQADMNCPVMHETAMQYTYPPPIYPVFFPIHQVSEEQAEVEGGAHESPTVMHLSYSTFYPGFFSPGLPYCPGYAPHAMASRSHEIIKPLAVHSKSPIKVDERLGLSKLSLGVCNGEVGSLILRPGLVGGSQRQSAFQSGASTGGSNLGSGSGSSSSSSPIHAT